MNNTSNKLKIAVSSCLLGNKVRYDGKHKQNPIILSLCETFDCIAICPESEIGLGTPRPALMLVKINDSIRVRGKTNPNRDVTSALTKHAQSIAQENQDIYGYVFKSRSPSCGIESTPLFDTSSREQGVTSGVFSAEIQTQLPGLPIIEETRLFDKHCLQEFISSVEKYALTKKERQEE